MSFGTSDSLLSILGLTTQAAGVGTMDVASLAPVTINTEPAAG